MKKPTTRRNNTAEETVFMSFRIAKRCASALRDAIGRMQYPPSQSALMDRAIDLLIADLKKKKEI